MPGEQPERSVAYCRADPFRKLGTVADRNKKRQELALHQRSRARDYLGIHGSVATRM